MLLLCRTCSEYDDVYEEAGEEEEARDENWSSWVIEIAYMLLNATAGSGTAKHASAEADASAERGRSAGQSVHESAPCSELYVFTGHGAHGSIPLEFWWWPGEQLSQE